METVLPQQPANPDNLPVVVSQASSPFAEEYITLSKEEHIELTCSAKYWQNQHARALDRETALKKRVAELEAEVRDLKQRLYGKKSEKGGTTKNEGNGRGASTRPRGQQPGPWPHQTAPLAGGGRRAGCGPAGQALSMGAQLAGTERMGAGFGSNGLECCITSITNVLRSGTKPSR